MAIGKSFKGIITDLFYNDIYDRLSLYVEDNSSRLECYSNFVKEPDETSIIDIQASSPLTCPATELSPKK